MKNKINRKIYCFWTGDNSLTQNRINGLETMRKNLGVEIDFIDNKSLQNRLVEGHPLHPGYKYLSCNHKSDYLRCYFMHFYGGGYSDIKYFSNKNNWKKCFDMMDSDECIQVIGTKEIKGGAATKEFNNPNILNKLLQNGWFICRPQTDFTTEWYRRLLKKMDERYDDLRKFPSTEPFGGKNYKIRWAEIQGEIFHKLLNEKYNEKTIKNCLESGRLCVAYR